MKPILNFLILSTVLLLSSCHKDEDAVVCDPTLLKDTHWEVFALGPVDTPSLILPMVERGSFYLDTTGRFIFNDGCNDIDGYYTTSAECGFHFHPESSTIVGCIPYPVIRNTRGEVMHIISKIESFEIQDPNLILRDSLGQESRWEQF